MPPILSFHPYLINRPSQHLKLTITKTVCKGDCSLTKFVVLTCLASVRQSRLQKERFALGYINGNRIECCLRLGWGGIFSCSMIWRNLALTFTSILEHFNVDTYHMYYKLEVMIYNCQAISIFQCQVSKVLKLG